LPSDCTKPTLAILYRDFDREKEEIEWNNARAVATNELEAKLLQVEQGTPLLMLDSISYLDDDRPVEYYHAVHRGDRSRFEVELVRFRDSEKALDTSHLPQSNPLIR
jgi:GntR family transcriptional regulator